MFESKIMDDDYMGLKGKVLLSILKLTEDGETNLEKISQNSSIIPEMVEKTVKDYLFKKSLQFENNQVILNSENRVELAFELVKLGFDLKQVCKNLNWSEFEFFPVKALEANGFLVMKNYRFKSQGRRWEIDLLGFNKPYILSIDCKHWQKSWNNSSIGRVARLQVKRTSNLCDVSQQLRRDLNIVEWQEAHFIPIILSLMSGPLKFYEKTPIVPILFIREFLVEVLPRINLMKYFTKKFPTTKDVLQ